MIVVMESAASRKDIDKVTDSLVKSGMQVQENQGTECTVLGVLGDTYTIDKEMVGMMSGVERVVSVQEPYKKANRKFHPENTVIDVKGVKVGGDKLAVMAGPCSVESMDQLLGIAKSVKKSGAAVLRGGRSNHALLHMLPGAGCGRYRTAEKSEQGNRYADSI
jgi:3-deoxy-7-phosphoheptulonate synthase